jgi:hypothetical protein
MFIQNLKQLQKLSEEGLFEKKFFSIYRQTKAIRIKRMALN